MQVIEFYTNIKRIIMGISIKKKIYKLKKSSKIYKTKLIWLKMDYNNILYIC